jgi:solute:Na+ symporter, SSS family
MHWLDAAIVFAFIAYAMAAGLRSRRVAGQNLEEYFLAGRSLPGWKAGCSMAATQFAADTPLLVTGLVATAGIFAVWRLWIFGVAFLLLGFVLAASWRRARVLTDAELTELRYGSRAAAWLRGVKAIYFGTIFNCTVLAWVLLAATRIAEPFLLWDAWLPAWAFQPFYASVTWLGAPLSAVPDLADPTTWPPEVWVRSTNNLISILAIIAVTTFYSTTGGLRSVVNTDVAQLTLMLAGTALFAWAVITHDAVGGLSAIPTKLREMFPAADPGPLGISADQILAFTPSMAKDVTAIVLIVFAVQWLVQMNADGTGYLAQRTMACRSDADAKAAAVIFTLGQTVLRSLLWLPLVLGLLIVFPPETAADAAAALRERTYVDGIRELLPVGVKGLILAAMLAALSSTVDTQINWGSSYWTNDLFHRFVCRAWLRREPKPRTLVWVARASNPLILLIALAIMTRLGSIEAAWHIVLLLGAGMGVVLVLRWLWWRITAWGELTSIAASTLLAPILLYGVQGAGVVESLGPAGLELGEARVSFFGVVDIGSQHPAEWRLLLMAALSSLAGVGVSLLSRGEALDRLVDFYRRARPPGYWGPVAVAAGADPALDRRRMWRGLAAVAVCSLSTFALLIGLGSWLVDSPAPAWFPWKLGWNVAMITLGIATVPLWWRLAFSKRGDVMTPISE